jgi:recombination protein RecT
LKYSKGYKAKKGYTFWEKDFDGMAYKTMLRQLISKWGIMSIDMQKAVESDQAVINEDGSKSYVDNTPDTPIDAEMTEVPAEEPKATENPTPSSENDVANELFGGQN